MALKVELKPHERIIIGACVVTNTDQRARLLIDGDRIPILREKDILTPETADTPAKLVYLAVQLMYLSPDPMAHHPTYFSLVRDILTTMPSAWPFIEGINNYILNGDLYHALKESKKLIGHEEQMLEERPKSLRRTRSQVRVAQVRIAIAIGAQTKKASARRPFCLCEPSSLRSDRQELGQRGLVEHRRGLIRGLQAGLQRQDLGRDLVLVDALDLVEHGLRHPLSWVWRSVDALIAVCAPANSACMSWIDCWPVCGARFAEMRCCSALTCAFEFGLLALVVTAAYTAMFCN